MSQSLEGLSPTEKRMLLAQLLQKQVAGGSVFPTSQGVFPTSQGVFPTSHGVFPMSHGQKGLWLLHQLEPDNPAYNIAYPSRLRSQLDVDVLRQTVATLIQRHASLRTTFAERGGELVQCVQTSMPVAVKQIDAGDWSDAELQSRLTHAATLPFSLEDGPLIRFDLFSRAPDDHVFLAVVHHIAVDFWSLVVLINEFDEIYTALRAKRTPRLPLISRSYADFVQWQTRLLEGEQGQQLAAYWQQQLAGAAPVLELPTDRPRPAHFSYRAGVVPCRLPRDVTLGVKDLAAREKVTPYAVLMAAYQVLLSHHSGQRDFLVGSPFVGRSRPGFEATVGYFVNMLPIRAQLEGDPTFQQLLHQVGATALDALGHQDYPYPLIVNQCHVHQDPSRPPLVQVSFTLERSHRQEQVGRGQFLFPGAHGRLDGGDGLDEEPFYVEQQACRHELELVLEQSCGSINGLLCYCADLFDESMMALLMQRYETLLRSAVNHPQRRLSQLEWFSENEKAQVVHEWNDTNAAFPNSPCLHHLFQQQAMRTPDAAAVTFEDREYSYGELDAWAERLARQLAARGIRRGNFVALCLDRSPDFIATVLAILKTGAVCVPLDPNTPEGRLQVILADVDPVAVIVPAGQASGVQAGTNSIVISLPDLTHSDNEERGDRRPLDGPTSPDDLAYVIYTSGSTGQPKGVMVSHRAICNTLQWRARDLPVDASDCVLMALPCFFDASLCISFATLTQGATLALVPPGEELNPTSMLEMVAERNVTVLPATPRLLSLLIEHPQSARLLQSVRQVQTGGEVLSTTLCNQVVNQLKVPLVNLYGPTEAAVEATYWVCRPGDRPARVAIGRPIANVRTFVLDASRQPVPLGVPGELYIGGAGLARGYLNDPQRTAESFLPCPLSDDPNQRLYRTGDRCRWTDDGNLEFLGRFDQQVKLRGYRIELEEIEHHLVAQSTICDAAVAVRRNQSQESELVAYIVVASDVTKTAMAQHESELRHVLLDVLPGYMVPTRFELLDELPRTGHGKLDRRALPELQHRVLVQCDYVAPRNPLEQFLVGACQHILQLQRIGIHDSFYDLGGNSIQGATLLAMLQDELGERIQTAALFDLTEIGDLAKYLAINHHEAVVSRFGPESSVSAQQLASASCDPHDAGPAGALTRLPGDLIVPIQPGGNKIPLFMVHPPGGIVICYQPLAKQLGDQQPLYGIRARGLHGETDLPTDLASMASEYVTAIRTIQPSGPYCLGGWSLGGVVAFEMAQQLVSAGESVRHLVLLDTTIPQGQANQQYLSANDNTGLEYGLDVTLDELANLKPGEQLPYLWEHARKLGVIDDEAPESLVRQVLDDLKRLFHSHLQLASQYTISPYPGPVTLMRPSDAPVAIDTTPDRGWRQLASSVDVHFVPGQHHSMVKEPHVVVLARKLANCLEV